MDHPARLGRRVAALIVDWAACSLVSLAFFGHNSWVTLGLFVLEQAVLVATLGSGFGHAILRMRVRREDGTAPGPLRALARALLLAVVIPAVIYDSTGRGLHDRLPQTVLVRR